MHTFVLVSVFAVLIERFLQVIAKPVLQFDGPITAYVAFVLGIGAAIGFNVDLFQALGIAASVPLAGEIATGIVIGGGSHYANDVISLVRALQGSPANLVSPPSANQKS